MSVISFNDFQNKYRFDCQLSQGSFGRVCRIQQVKTKKYFALKKITVKKKQQLQEIQNEIQILKRFKHPFVVQIKQTYNIQIQNGFSKPIWQVGIVLQLAKYSLDQIIRIKKSPGPFEFIIQQTAGLIRILFILQQQNIAHRDIKPANILIFQTHDNNYRWKLADFGLALNLSQTKESENFAGSFQYASPKLKKKFKYPSIKIKTNHFKDDVYSLGVTLLETITGLRNYNNAAYQKLREICHYKELVDLIDIMLEQDEEKRPCFKQLMMIIQKDLKLTKDIDQLQNTLQNLNRQKHGEKSKGKHNQVYNPYSYLQKQQQPEHISQKTIIKHTQKVPNKISIKTEKGIQCVANIDGAIMCGCDDGQLIFILNNKVVECGSIHTRNVSQFFVDSSGHVWSVGGDCTIKRWSKGNIIKSLISEVEEVSIVQNRLLKKPIQKKTSILHLKPCHFQTIQVPPHKSGVSSIHAQDENNFIIGYYDGYIYTKWKGNEFHGQLFSKPVTAVKTNQDCGWIWACSLDGQVKGIQCASLRVGSKFYFRDRCGFVDLYVNQTDKGQLITLLTLDGKHIILDSNLECIFEQQMAKKTIMCSVQSNKNCYVLTQSGQIIDLNQERVIELGSRGWNCLTMLTENEMVAGNFLGELVYLEL